MRTRLLAIKKSLRPSWLSALNKWTRSRMKLGRLAHEFGLGGVSSNPLLSHKRSDTLFVLGSGSSINQLRPEDWAAIAAADSIGFNYWLLNEFVPNHYMFEPHLPFEATRWLMHNFRLRGQPYQTMPIIMKDGERYRPSELASLFREIPQEIRKNVVLSWDWEIQSEDAGMFARKLDRLDRLGILAGSRFPALRKRASVCFITMLAMRAGYKKIVLCGIDLNNADYFYARDREALEAQGYIVPPPPRPSNQPHKTEDPDFGSLTVSVVLDLLNQRIMKKRRIELFVALQSSKLYPMLPSYFGH